MRPRITRAEAAYLVTVLEPQIESMKTQLENLKQIERDLTLLIYNLKNPVQPEYSETGNYAGNRILGDQELICYVKMAKELKAEHPFILGEKCELYKHICIHEKLLAKYRAIANGEHHQGKYKHFSSVLKWELPEPKQIEVTT